MLHFFLILKFQILSINGDYFDNSRMVLYEDAYYIGCFNDHFLKFPQFEEASSSHFNLSDCFEKCKNKDFSFAGAIKINNEWSRCICENRNATIVRDQAFCECQCNGEIPSFCGCFPSYRLYSLKNRSASYELHLNYIGKNSFHAKKQFTTNNKWNSNILAAKKCAENKNFSFSSLVKNDFYECLSADDIIERIDINNLKNESNGSKFDNGELEHETMDVYFFEKKQISIKCPSLIIIDELFECELNVKFFDDPLEIEMDFNDGETQIFNMDNGVHSFKKIYNVSGLFTINVRIKDKKINLNPLIFVKKNFTSLNWTDHSSISIYENQNYFQFIGCFFNQWNIYPDPDKIKLENAKTKIDSCEECKKRNFTYAIISQSGHFCTNKYGLYDRLNDNKCECACRYANDENCGCSSFEMVYKLKGGSELSTPRASFKGCFYTESVLTSNYLGRNTAILCLKYCIKKNVKFLAISNGFECFCENENNFGLQVETTLCDIKCPGNSKEICGGYFGLTSLYEITYELSVLTSSASEIILGQSVDLNLRFVGIPFREIFNFTIDFGDGETKKVVYSDIDLQISQDQSILSIIRQNESSITEISFGKKYKDIGPYSISVYNKEEKNILAINILIKNNETMCKDFKSKFIFIYENGDYIGCFWNIDYVQINYHLLIKNQEICAIQCISNGFIFSATQNRFARVCLCRSSNPIYQARSSCHCACPYSNHRFCGCNSFSRLYKIQTNTTKTAMIGIYSGCFMISPNFKDGREFGFLSNDNCIIYCNENKYSYAATKMGTLCTCSNSLDKNNQDDELNCDIKCNGNHNQTCGGYFRNSVYQIINLKFDLMCPKTCEKYLEISCLINVTSDQHFDFNYTLLVDFGDSDVRQYSLALNCLLQVNKTFNRTGKFRIFSAFQQIPFNNTAFIEVTRSSLEIDHENDYQGCYYDTIPLEINDLVFVNKNKMTNEMCQIVCSNFGYNFSATYNQYQCSCGNSFGSYNKANNCDLKCPGNISEFCGGKVYYPFSVYISDPASYYYGMFSECTTVNKTGLEMLTQNTNLKCLEACRDKSFYRSHFRNSLSSAECYCSDEKYKIIEIDYSNSNCDYRELGGEGGSDYFLKSVFKVNHKELETNMKRFYLNHSGCVHFDPAFKEIFIDFKNNSAFKCAIFCKLMNSSILASMMTKCFCLKNFYSNFTNPNSINCGLEASEDGHYNGNFQKADQYIINEIPQELISNGKNYFEEQVCNFTFLHQVISPRFLDELQCINFCFKINFKLAQFINKICYCGNDYKNEIKDNCGKIFLIKETVSTTILDAQETTSPIENLSSYSNQKLDLFDLISSTSSSSDSQTTEAKNLSKSDPEEFLSLNSEKFANLISTIDYDISGCLANCSNHGTCKKNHIQRYECMCETDHFGKSCEKNKKPCSNAKLCVNNSTCLDLVNFQNGKDQIKYDYVCLCSQNFYGQHCEKEINLCENKTCSKNGYCRVNATGYPECRCLKHYSGSECEIKNKELVFIQTIIKASTIISIAFLVSLGALIIFNDVMNIFLKKNITKKPKKADHIIKYTYKQKS